MSRTLWVIILLVAMLVGCFLLPEGDPEPTDAEIACLLDPADCEEPDYWYEPYRW